MRDSTAGGGHCQPALPGSRVPAARGLRWDECVWALGNVLALVVGDLATKAAKVPRHLCTNCFALCRYAITYMLLSHRFMSSNTASLASSALHTPQGGREVRYLQRAALLDPAEAPGVGDEVVATAAALLSAARRSAQSAGSHASADAAGVSTPCLDSKRGCTEQSCRVT